MSVDKVREALRDVGIGKWQFDPDRLLLPHEVERILAVIKPHLLPEGTVAVCRLCNADAIFYAGKCPYKNIEMDCPLSGGDAGEKT